MENMNNGTQQVVGNDGAASAQPVQEVPQQVVAAQAPAVVPETKEPNFFKKHWKKLVAGAAAVAAAAGSAFVAYNKGKQAGAVCYPPNDGEDYSLNPNVE